MLPRPPATTPVESLTGSFPIGSGILFARTLRRLQSHDHGIPRRAIFIHGEGLGGNHSLLERPARWLIARDLFDEIILPDRRGCGASSPITRRMTLQDQADDMRRLLDAMKIEPPVTAIGVSFAGPVAVVLASIDPRVCCAVMVASSPARRPAGRVEQVLLRSGLLGRLAGISIRRRLGKRAPQPVNFDPGYDSINPRLMSTLFADALSHMPADRAESLRYEWEAARDSAAASLAGSLRLEIPVLQVIGEGDEEWDTELPAGWAQRFPNFHRREVPGAAIHKDLYLKAELFYRTLFDLLEEACPGTRQGGGGEPCA